MTNPTGEQQAVLEAFGAGGDLVVQAGAGTGKTTTLRMVAESTGRRGIYVAYNKAIALDARAKFPRNVACSTAHALAFRAVGYRYQHRLDAPRQTARQSAEILGLTAPLHLGSDVAPLAPQQLARIVLGTVARFCRTADQSVDTHHVPRTNGYDAPGVHEALARQIAPLATKAWEDLAAVGGRLRFVHDHYLKMWQLSGLRLAADFVLLDEAQDADPVIAHVVGAQTHTQRIAVGDSAQAIYEWRGAIDAMRTWPGARLTLSQSFRFGEPIAQVANTWLDVLSAPLRLRGFTGITSRLQELPAARAVLCRTNAGAMDQVMDALADGRHPALVGGGKAIRALAEAALDLKAGRATSHPELFAFASWGEVQDYVEHDQSGDDLKTLVKLIEAYGPPAIIAAADRLTDETHAELIVSTAHKAKGREWPTVRIGDDFPQPKTAKDGTPGPIPPVDARLAYVAVTRARHALDRGGLGWIDGHLAVLTR
jgi:hypothetical protein